ncbi:MAG TPA: aromatic ring-hydroxylating dioxygenase subunit alpha [Blastocatellia bacterium]
MVFRRTAETFAPYSMTLPAEFYNSADIFAEELEKIFYDRWVCVGRASQLAIGNHLALKIGNESLVLARDSEGTLRAFFNVCRHRGALVCTQGTAHPPGLLRCPYHGWTYDLTGSLVRAPSMEEVDGFDKAKSPLHPVAVENWEGFLFVNLAKEPEPFGKAFAPVLNRFSQWGLEGLSVARTIEYEIAANWKIIVENYSECYHCPLLHPEFSRRVPFRSGKNDLFQGPFLGGFMDLSQDFDSLTVSGGICAPRLQGISGDDDRRVYFYALFPNMTLSLHPDYAMYFTLWPLANDRTKIVCEWLFEAEGTDRGNCDPDDAVQFWDEVNRQDWRVCELVQQGTRSRAYGPSPYCNTESLLVAFNQEVRKALGRPAS